MSALIKQSHILLKFTLNRMWVGGVMKKYGKSGRPGKRRRNMPGYYLGVNKIGRKSWFASRRPEDIEKYVTKYDFLNGKVKPGAIFALSKKSNAVFLGIHRNRVLYYNPKTDRIGHTGLGRFGGQLRPFALLKEKAGIDYFKSENNWMNHRKIPGSDLRVSDVLTNPYRKTIAKKVGDQFIMPDYHESAVVGDVLYSEKTGLKAEVTAITKKGIAFRVFDGTPGGRHGHINIKNPRLRDRHYTLVKSAVNQELEVKDLQEKFKEGSYDVVKTDKGGSVANRRGRPAGSLNRPLTEEEKKIFKNKMNENIRELDEISSENVREHLELVKKIISHSNKIGDEEVNKKYKKIRQQLNYKIGLHDRYDEAETTDAKLEAAKAALKYEERIGGRESAIKMWKDRVNELAGGKEDANEPKDQTKKKPDESNEASIDTPKKIKTEELIAQRIEESKDDSVFKDEYKKVLDSIKFNPSNDEATNTKQIERLEGNLEFNFTELQYEDLHRPEDYKKMLARYHAIKTGLPRLKEDFEFSKKIDEYIDEYNTNDRGQFNNAVKSYKAIVKSTSDFDVKRIIENCFKKLKENEVAGPVEDRDFVRKLFAMQYKAAKDVLNRRLLEQKIDLEVNELKNDQYFKQRCMWHKRELDASLKNDPSLNLENLLDTVLVLMPDQIDRNETSNKGLLAQYKVINDLIKERNPDAYKMTMEQYLSRLNVAKGDPRYPELVAKYQKSVVDAVKDGKAVDEKIKRSVPMFNSWDGDSVTGSDMREEFKKIKMLDHNTWALIPYGVEEGDTFEQAISKIKNSLDLLHEQYSTSSTYGYSYRLQIQRQIDDAMEAFKNTTAFYNASIIKKIKEHLESSTVSDIDVTVELKNHPTFESYAPSERNIKINKFSDNLNKGVEFIKKMLCKREGEFAFCFRTESDMASQVREGYLPESNTVSLSLRSEPRAVVHEMAHRIEEMFPDAKKMCVDFVKRRTQGEELVRLKDIFPNAGFRDDEMTRRDKFVHPYVGKIYTTKDGFSTKWDQDTDYDEVVATEVLSHGLEVMFYNPLELLKKDPEHFDLVWKIMRGGGKAVG